MRNRERLLDETIERYARVIARLQAERDALKKRLEVEMSDVSGCEGASGGGASRRPDIWVYAVVGPYNEMARVRDFLGGVLVMVPLNRVDREHYPIVYVPGHYVRMASGDDEYNRVVPLDTRPPSYEIHLTPRFGF